MHESDYFCYVLVKPEVYIYQNIDDNVLICNATGFPSPALTWYKNSEYVTSSKNTNEKDLTIKETVGNFTCVASNSAGTSSESFVSSPGKTLYFVAARKKLN